MGYVTPDKYSPYPRTCDICGQLRSIQTMRKLDNVTWVCDKHTGERTALMLDTLNANIRPPIMWPNKDARPQDPVYPNALATDEGELFNFLEQQVTARARYELVTSGDGAPYAVNVLQTMGWAARYFYDLIVQGTAPAGLISRAKTNLNTIAAYVQTRQAGFGLFTTATRSSFAWYGGFIDTGSTVYVTQNASMCGLALLYAYRIFGTNSYLQGARAAASYLRNVQSIGKCAVQCTSSNSAGTARLYTGAVASQVSSQTGFDPGTSFYSDHCFYPFDLLALEFWNELLTTDGDQSLGCDSLAVDAFVFLPTQTLSQSIADMRTFWTNGVRDSANETYTGLSSTTPREFFNAYPATKTYFGIIGTGRWEFQDGGASTGTMITAQNFGTALGALYAYEGQSTQVGTIFDWLQTFESNGDFETPDGTSDSVLARSTTGDFDATVCPSTLLQVRDADDSYSAIAQNGSSLYDWGAFGAMARLWSARKKSGFMSARTAPLNITQRYDDGKPTDGMFFDRIQLRGLSGLSMQTSFSTTFGTGIGSDGGYLAVTVDSPSMPASTVFYVDGTTGLHLSGNKVTGWDDQSTQAQHLNAGNSGDEPTVGTDSLDGIPGVSFPLGNTTPGSTDPNLTRFVGRASNLRARDGKDFGIDPGNHPERTVIAVIRPKHYSLTTDLYGGTVVQFRQQAVAQTTFSCMFFQQAYFNAFEPIWELYSTDGPYGVFNMKGPDTTGATYENQIQIVIWRSNYPALDVSRNGNNISLSPSAIGTGYADGGLASSGFILGMQDLGTVYPNFQGTIFSVLVSDEYMSSADELNAVRFIASRMPTLNQYIAPVGMVNDAVRAAQFGRTYREAH